jgi:phage baseplate assembly protein W
MAGLDPVQGTAFPFRIDPATGRVATASGDEKVMQNVRVLLATRLGERPLERGYGTRLPGMVHDPNDEVLVDIAVQQTREAIMRWEPRVIPAEVSAERDPDAGQVNLRLGLQATNERRSGYLVVPLT